jgi:Major Facilitator Superfamily.
MGLYAFFLAGSNYFAPVICGFIAQYQGWRWVFYWPSIFIAFAVVFLFFFMEETNYVRVSVGIAESNSQNASSASSEHQDPEKMPRTTDTQKPNDLDMGNVYKKKTYIQKLSLINTNKGKNNNMLRRLYQTLYFLSWPVVFYAGYVFKTAIELDYAILNAWSF